MDILNFILNWVEHEKSFITSGPGVAFKTYFAKEQFLLI